VAEHLASIEPSPWIVRWADLFPERARVLDLACGGGRHARLFAACGHSVLAVDRDPGAIAALAGEPAIEARTVDLEQGEWPLAGESFDAIVVTNYLHRPLFPHLAAALRPGGVLLYETFAAGNEKFGRPSRPEFLLDGAELLRAFGAELEIVAFEQGHRRSGRPAVLQRLCAVRGAALDAALE
jgi:SAM-dependent methyltransferase